MEGLQFLDTGTLFRDSTVGRCHLFLDPWKVASCFVMNEVRRVLQLRKLWVLRADRPEKRGCLRGRESSLEQSLILERVNVHCQNLCILLSQNEFQPHGQLELRTSPRHVFLAF